ncbi:MAG: hypothetical protein IKT70_06990 [Clostridia bacterium]|nr:hypothetical protein [Clostridia bacterium]
MKDKHIFSKAYTERREAVLTAMRREESIKAENRAYSFKHMILKMMASAAILTALTVSVYAAAQWIEFHMEKSGDEVRIHASLSETGKSSDSEEKPLRSWRAEDGEISVSLQIPDLPADMSEDRTASGKYGSDNSSRSMTINGIDLRRSDLDQIISGAINTKQLNVGGRSMYVVEKGEAYYYNRIAYIVFEEDELVLKLWISHGITDEELHTLAATITLEYTTDTLLAIPIHNELVDGTSTDVPDVICSPDDPIYEADLIRIGESARDDSDRYTITVNDVDVYDNIGTLDSDFILRRDFVNRFVDAYGKLIPYNRTQIVWIESEGKEPTKAFREDESAIKKLFVITVTVEDVSMDDLSEEDRTTMLKACINSYNLSGYTVNNGKLDIISIDAVVDHQPGETACSSEPIYREYIGDGQWRVAYLIDEDISENGLIMNDYIGGIAVKIK